MTPCDVWVLADPRAGTAAQALGIAERLRVPFRTVPLEWGRLARLPAPWPTLAGLTAPSRAAFIPPWPRLVIAAGRRSAAVALWLQRQGARTGRGAKIVHCMRPGLGASRFDLLVIGRHDLPSPAPNLVAILGATHRMSPERLAAARAEFADFAALPSPRVALLMGGPVRREGMDPAIAGAIAAEVAGFAGSILASASRRTGRAAEDALAAACASRPHRLFRWGDPGPNPYAGMLAWADAVVVSGDSVSMISEALATSAPVYIADPRGLGRRHRRLHASLIAADQARMLEGTPTSFARTALDESGRVAAEIRARALLPD